MKTICEKCNSDNSYFQDPWQDYYCGKCGNTISYEDYTDILRQAKLKELREGSEE